MPALIQDIAPDENWYEIRAGAELKSLSQPVARQHPDSTKWTTLNFTRRQAYLLEGIDDFFQHDSALMMPDSIPLWASGIGPTETGNSGDELVPDEERISGAFVLATVFKVMQKNPEHALVVVGHCDTTGRPQYNQDLSVLRARCVLSVLVGKRDDFCQIAEAKSRTIDIQRVLLYYARTCVWGCNPGLIDDKFGPQTEAAVRSFQRGYNQTFAKNIDVDGKVGKQTWGAVFDLYQRELASVLGVSLAELQSLTTQLVFASDAVRSIGCGELFPIEMVGADGYSSRRNRRFEILFVRKDKLAQLPPLATDRAHAFYEAAHQQCGYLRPLMRGSDPMAELLDTREAIIADLELIDGNQEDEFTRESEGTDPDGSDWGFLDPFAAHHPGVGGAKDAISRA